MVVELPGLSLSILRQDTSTQAGKPVLLSGRFTAFGLGVPGLIRVSLSGPSYNPEVRTFDAFAQPFSGDWSVQVVTEKDGNYTVKAQAYLVPAIPSGPAFPENILLLPPIAESTEPPLVVGNPTEGGVNAVTPEGTEFLAAPAQTPIELMTSVGAPSVSVVLPGGAAAAAAPTPTVPPSIVITTPETPYTPAAPTPTVPTPSVPPVTIIQIPTTPTIPEVPSIPEVPEIPTLPEVPGLQIPTFPMSPTSSMLGTPIFGLPSQLDIGDMWSGNVQLPTIVPTAPSGFQQLIPGALELPSYTFTATVSLESPSGKRITAGSQSTNLQLGQPFYVPVNFNTAGLEEGRYNVYFTVVDESNRILFDNIIGRLYLVALPGVPAAGAAAPSLPSLSMFGTPVLSAPSSVTQGEKWTGSISLPTTWPSSLPTPPALPSYPVALQAFLQSPSGSRTSVGLDTPSFKPGQRLSLPLSVDTSKLPQAGNYNVLMSITDQAGNMLLPLSPIGLLNVLAAAAAKIPTPEVPALSQFSAVTVSLSPRTVKVGDTVTIPVTYTHIGVAETRTVRAAIGQNRGYFDEILWGTKTISVPLDVTPQRRTTSVPVTISSKISPGTYGIYGKVEGTGVGGLIGQEVSPSVWNVVQVQAEAAAPSIEPSYIPRIDVQLSATSVAIGSSLRVPYSYQHRGEAERVTVYAAIGQKKAGTFDEILHASQSLSIPLDTSLTSRTGSISIPISTAIAAGKTYGVYVKIMRTSTGRGEVVSAYKYDLVTITGGAAPTVTPKYDFSIGSISASPSKISGTQRVVVSAAVTSKCNVAAKATVYFRFYEGSVFATHGDFLGQSTGMTYEMKPGETHTFTGARTETSSKSRFDVECRVYVNGQQIDSREDDDVYRR
jgi:hypothetical protein